MTRICVFRGILHLPFGALQIPWCLLSSHTSLQAWNKCKVCFWSDRSFKDLLNGIQPWLVSSLSLICAEIDSAAPSSPHFRRMCCRLFCQTMGFVVLSFPFSATGWTDAPPLLFYLKPYIPMPSPTVTINVLCWLNFMRGATSKLTGTELKDRTLQKSSVLSVHYWWPLVPEK